MRSWAFFFRVYFCVIYDSFELMLVPAGEYVHSVKMSSGGGVRYCT